MEGFLTRGRELILPGWRWLCEPRVGVFTPCVAVSTRGTTVFVLGLLELQVYARISNPGMGSHPSRVARALRAPPKQQSASGVGVFTPCGAVSTRGITGFDPGLLEL